MSLVKSVIERFGEIERASGFVFARPTFIKPISVSAMDGILREFLKTSAIIENQRYKPRGVDVARLERRRDRLMHEWQDGIKNLKQST